MEKGIRKVETATDCILEGRQMIGRWRLEMPMDMDEKQVRGRHMTQYNGQLTNGRPNG
jgi:hypothetical protein